MLKNLAVGDLGAEFAATRRLLERLPEDRLTFRPHEKSWTLGSLAGHIANIPYWMLGTLTSEGFDLSASPAPRHEPTSVIEILETFDRNARAVRMAFEEADDEALQATWTLRQGEQVLSARPRVSVLRQWGISHLIHHRGQLTVYLRLLDVPLPPLYGPTADEQPVGA